MKQRPVLAIALLAMIGLIVASVSFFSARFAGWSTAQSATPTPLPTPTPTPALFSGTSAYLLDTTSGRVLLAVNSQVGISMWRPKS